MVARRVLLDCQSALEMLDNEENEQRWRVLWAGAITLLRSVGHVLHKVDGEGPVLRPLIDSAYNRWKADRSGNAVYWEFIEKERNNILKEYQFHVHETAEVGVVVARDVVDADSGHTSVMEGEFTLQDNLFRPVTDGFGQGEDARDVYREAMTWWHSELQRIEAQLDVAEERSCSSIPQ